jgi:hypothetical protein
MSLYHLHPSDSDDNINREPELDIPTFEDSHLDLAQVIDLTDYNYDDSDVFFND